MPISGLLDKAASKSTKSAPKWMAIQNYFIKALQEGRYHSGDMLPSENSLCKELNFARNTVRQAMDALEEAGMIRRIKGSGTFVTSQVAEKGKGNLQAYGLVIPEIRRSLFPSLARGFDSVAYRRQHASLICNTDYDIDKQGNIILQLLDKRVAGVAIVPPTLEKTPLHHIRPLQLSGIPFVFCHRRVPGVSAPLVSWDFEQVGRLAGQTLLQSGHRQAAFLGVYRYPTAEAYERGFRQALGEAGVELPAAKTVYGPLETSENHLEEREAMVHALLCGPNRPTAVFCSDDNEAERVFWIAQTLGLRIPDDLSIIGVGDVRRDTEFLRRLVSIVIDEFHLGAKAADLLEQMGSERLPLNDSSNHLMELQVTGSMTLGPPPA